MSVPRGIVQINPKYRGPFNTLAFEDIKPHRGSLRDRRLDLVYYQNPGLSIGDPFSLWIDRREEGHISFVGLSVWSNGAYARAGSGST